MAAESNVDDDRMNKLRTTLRARVEYEISDASRDGPRVHQRVMDAMEVLNAEVMRQAAESAERTEELASAAQRGIKHLIEVATGSRTDEEWQQWLRERGVTEG